jgi:hypothetical protein
VFTKELDTGEIMQSTLTAEIGGMIELKISNINIGLMNFLKVILAAALLKNESNDLVNINHIAGSAKKKVTKFFFSFFSDYMKKKI